MREFNELKKLKRTAKLLPVEIETVKQRVRVTGEELIKDGVTNIGENEKIKQNQVYVATQEKKRRVNHADKLKQAYKTGGVRGVKTYLDKYVDLENKEVKP